LTLSALAAWIIVSVVSYSVSGRGRRAVQAFIVLCCSWALGLAVYAMAFALGEALLDASFRARLPIIIWVIYYAYVGAYLLNVGLGLSIHIIIAGIFGLGAGRWLYERFDPKAMVP
jgi:hypothetical protein